jgi:hypothetical protein
VKPLVVLIVALPAAGAALLIASRDSERGAGRSAKHDPFRRPPEAHDHLPRDVLSERTAAVICFASVPPAVSSTAVLPSAGAVRACARSRLITTRASTSVLTGFPARREVISSRLAAGARAFRRANSQENAGVAALRRELDLGAGQRLDSPGTATNRREPESVRSQRHTPDTLGRHGRVRSHGADQPRRSSPLPLW